jgi:hypothetical protein
MADTIREYCRANNVQLTAVRFNPLYDEKKGRVSKGPLLAFPKWKDKGRYEDKNTHYTPQTMEEQHEEKEPAHGWLMYVKKSNIFVIDIDIHHTDKSFRLNDVFINQEELSQSSSYVVMSGSGGVHFYYKVPANGDSESLKNSTKNDELRRLLIHQKYWDKVSVDLIVDSIVTEGSYYTYDGEQHVYKSIKGVISDVEEMPETMWKNLIQPITMGQSKMGDVKNTARMMIEDSETIRQTMTEKPTSEEIAEHLANIPNESPNWEQWYRFGQALYNEDYSFDLFDQFSKRCTLYDMGTTIRLWKGLKKGSRHTELTVGTILYMSKESNPQRYREIRGRYKSASYRTVKLELEQTHFFVQEPKPRYIRIGRNGVLIEYTCYDFKELLAIYPKFKDSNGISTTFYDIYHQDPSKRIYTSIGYYPNPEKCPPTTYNAYRPPLATSYEEGKETVDLTPIFEHIALMTNEQELPEKERVGAHFIIQFMAQIVQQPTILKGMSIVMYGEEGAGKDLLWSWFGGDVLGSHLYTMCGSIDNLFKKFNAKLEGKLLCHMSEISIKSMKKYEEDMKRIIDAKVWEIEKKGKDTLSECQNLVRIVMTTNNRDALRASATDRRFVVYEASSKKINDPMYYESLVNIISTPAFISVFYNYLLQVDISNFCHQKRPHTQIYKDMKQSSIRPFLAFIHDLPLEPNVEKHTVVEWLRLYNIWASENNYFPTNTTALGVQFKEYLVKIVGGFEHTKPGNKSTFEVKKDVVRAYLVLKGVVDPSDSP